jgi:hypothetical protein
VTRGIVGDYLRTVISPDITSWRERICPDVRVIVIFDGHKAHLHAMLNAWAADNIILCALPPHSSHLLQPLDQGFFHRLKVQYALFRNSSGLSKISGILERVWMVIEASSVTRLIWNAWSHTGIIATITNCTCNGFRLDVDHVLSDPGLQPVSGGAERVFEGARGRGVVSGEWGVLNEDEMLIWQAGQCPFCCIP